MSEHDPGDEDDGARKEALLADFIAQFVDFPHGEPGYSCLGTMRRRLDPRRFAR